MGLILQIALGIVLGYVLLALLPVIAAGVLVALVFALVLGFAGAVLWLVFAWAWLGTLLAVFAAWLVLGAVGTRIERRTAFPKRTFWACCCWGSLLALLLCAQISSAWEKYQAGNNPNPWSSVAVGLALLLIASFCLYAYARKQWRNAKARAMFTDTASPKGPLEGEYLPAQDLPKLQG